MLTLTPTKAPTATPTKVPTAAPTAADSFTHACLADCPCPDQSKASATCPESKAFAAAATRPGETCLADCDPAIKNMVALAAAKQCVEEGSTPDQALDWGDAGVRSNSLWGRRQLQLQLQLQLEQATPSACTLAPTNAPTRSPTPSPTQFPTLTPTAGTCRTSATLAGGAAGRGKPCAFPFVYKGRRYDGCTDVDSDEGLWCSTKTDWWGAHVSGEGEWGTCVDAGPGSDCDLPCRTTGDSRAPAPRAACVFPFVFGGVTYTSCAPEVGFAHGWCSTQTDLFDNHISGHWGYCNIEGCPNPIGTAEVGRYPGYAGGAQVSGSFAVSPSGAGSRYTYTISGLAPNSQGGWHVHEGFSCADAGAPGGHYYDRGADGGSPDPWIPVKWNSDANGVATATLDFSSFPLPVSGRTIVVHDSNGVKAGCGTIDA